MTSELGTADPSGARPLHEQLAQRPALASSDGAAFARLLYPEYPAEPTVPLTVADHADIAAEAFAFIAERARGTPELRVRPLLSAAGGTLSVLEIVNDDMPFLLDSVMSEIQARGLSAHLVLHPMFKARRDARGRLDAVLGKGDRNWRDGVQESLIIVLLDALSEPAADDLLAALAHVLQDVRAAVDDWPLMLSRLDEAIGALEARSAGEDLVAETVAFCRWLRAGQFTFLGTREYRLVGEGETAKLQVMDGSGLGVLRDPAVHVLRRGRELVAMTPEVRRFFFAPQPIIITKSSVVSRVHRRVHMDYIGLKMYEPGGRLAGELRIVGLFTSRAYTEPPQQIPFLRLKVERVVGQSGYSPESHDGKALLHILETFPRDELFQIGIRQLAAWAEAILDLEVRPRTRGLARVDRFDRFVSVLVYLPRDRFSTARRERIGAMLAEAYEGRLSAFKPFFTEGPLVRVHYIIGRFGGPTPAVAEKDLEDKVRAILRTWSESLADAIAAARLPAGLAASYARAFSPAYAEVFGMSRALADISRIERLDPASPVAIDFYREAGDPDAKVRAAIYRYDRPIPLSERVPILENLGFRVVDERSYRVRPEIGGTRREVALHDMALETEDGSPVSLPGADLRLEDCYLAVERGAADNDPFNKLVLTAGANWREAAALRAYGAYTRQLGVPFGVRYVAETLNRHAGMARDLVELFRVRFEPGMALEEAAQDRARKVTQRFEGALANVPSLDEDRILRHMLNLLLATQRTNFFQRDGAGQPPETIAYKFATQEVDLAPEPRPFREIWVTSPRVDGVHLRFAPIARGGLRWSDRPQDFRTEVLGLAKAQQVKNAVIVPQGAKGGFVPKRVPRAGLREAVQREGTAAYRLFVATLLDLTDNIEDDAVVPPPGVVRHDGDDPYLVVAADKGTASFSDIANEIAAKRQFWLGDAFASGGSAGYDHKKMGITARGAWECVKRHFRELGRDILAEPFRVVGVGDMSGDVFGNGMLLSRTIRLLAAFDHRDIFIDPDPDPEASFGERRRLFELPRSSWQDYDRACLSPGGGVFSRSAKSIALSPEIRALLGIASSTLTPAELIRAVLSCKTDLMWFGGVGTYVRAIGEGDEQVGDRANDSLRITAAELGAGVVGEGANLAVTQRGRIEFALRGGRINTDFIDNSAGVNSSDQEVNIKIALRPATHSGRLSPQHRAALLASMTEDVAAACLANNHAQSLAISLAGRGGAPALAATARLVHGLEARGLIERKLEALPGEEELKERAAAGQGLTRPELAVVMSFSKIALTADLLASDLPDHAALEPMLVAYFPPALHEQFCDDLRQHRLRREIITTELTNGIINRGGIAFVHRLAEETGAPVSEIAAAFVAAERVFDLDALWDKISTLDGRVTASLQLVLYERVMRLYHHRAAWFAREGVSRRGLAETIAFHASVARELCEILPSLLPPPRAARLASATAEPVAAGVPERLARELALAEGLADSCDIALVIEAVGMENLPSAARAYFELAAYLGLAETRARAEALALSDPYDLLAATSALETIAAGQRTLTLDLLRSTNVKDPSLSRWLERRGPAIAQARERLARIAEGELSVSRLTVAAAEVAQLARS
jgi:glutamate dehydrogenase